VSRRLRWAWFTVVGLAVGISAILLAAVPAAANVGAFALVWGLGVGGLSVRYRVQAQQALAKVGLKGYLGFAVVVVVVSVAEESVCAGFGCALANPNFALDLLVVVPLWLVWLSAWYRYIAPRYAFDYPEALLVASAAGVLFETIGNGRALADPVGSTFGIPLVIVVYAGIVAIPLQLMPWTGTSRKRLRHLIAFIVPYLFVLPVAVALFVVLAASGLLH
jgi:hypothetical protein